MNGRKATVKNQLAAANVCNLLSKGTFSGANCIPNTCMLESKIIFGNLEAHSQ